MKGHILTLSLLVFLSGVGTALAQSVNTLWYDKPARYFEESLVLGNGKMGASVFGGVNSDKIYLNDATLWSGEPVDVNMNPEAYKNLPAIREALKNEDYHLADELNKKLQSKFSESYAPLGTLYINLKHEGNPENYYRDLNISNAVSTVRYETGDVKFTREYFISYPDQDMIIKLTSSKKGTLSFDIRFESLLKNKVSISENVLKANGYAPVHAEPSYRGEKENAVVFDESRRTRFTSLVKIKNTDGTIISTNNTIGIKEGSEALIFISIATSFNGFEKNPATQGINNEA